MRDTIASYPNDDSDVEFIRKTDKDKPMILITESDGHNPSMAHTDMKIVCEELGMFTPTRLESITSMQKDSEGEKIAEV